LGGFVRGDVAATQGAAMPGTKAAHLCISGALKKAMERTDISCVAGNITMLWQYRRLPPGAGRLH
jgi:hypothetical protein